MGGEIRGGLLPNFGPPKMKFEGQFKKYIDDDFVIIGVYPLGESWQSWNEFEGQLGIYINCDILDAICPSYDIISMRW